MCYKDTWYNIQMEIQDERLNKSMNVYKDTWYNIQMEVPCVLITHSYFCLGHMVQHTNGNTRWATKQKYECVIRTHGTTYKWKYKMSD